MFDPATVTFLDSPVDLGTWPATATIRSVTFPAGRMCVDHTGRDHWPDAPFGDGKGGTCQYTLGMCCEIGGKWYGAAVVQFWAGRDLAAGGDMALVAKDWFYDDRWGALKGHQPAPGEIVAWFAAAGNLRDNTNIGLHERTDFVLVPFGQEYHATATPPPPPPPPIPDPPPVPNPPPPVTPPADLVAVITAIQTASDREIAKLDDMQKHIETATAAIVKALSGLAGLGGLFGGLK